MLKWTVEQALKACPPNSRIKPKFWNLHGIVFKFGGKWKYHFPKNVPKFLGKFCSVLYNTMKTVLLNTTKPNFNKNWWKHFHENFHQFFWKFGFVVFNWWKLSRKWYFLFLWNLKTIPRKFQNSGLVLEFGGQALLDNDKMDSWLSTGSFTQTQMKVPIFTVQCTRANHIFTIFCYREHLKTFI